MTKNLILSHNKIKDVSIFERFFQVNKTLEGIDLSENLFSEIDAKNLMLILGNKNNIKWFNISKNNVEKKVVPTINLLKKSENPPPPPVIRSKTPPLTPLSLNNIHQRRPLPKKPSETGERVFFRMNLYQGPLSARSRNLDRPDSEDFGSKLNRVFGFEMADQGVQTSRNENSMIMSRVDWIIRIKDICYGLFSETKETLFSKSLIIDSIRKKEKTWPFVSQETYHCFHFEKGYSTNQVVQAIDSAQSNALNYDDIIELICNIEKAPQFAAAEPIIKPQLKDTIVEAPQESSIIEQSLLNTRHPPNLIECSFSFENSISRENKRPKLSSVNKKPPTGTPAAQLKRSSQEENLCPPKDENSPAEVETARFKKESNQPSASKDNKQESYRLEISSEISSLIDIGIRFNESLSYDIDSTIHEMNTTAKLMSALGDTPNNLSNLNMHNNTAAEKLSSLEPNVSCFSVGEKNPQAAALRGTLNQVFGNKVFKMPLDASNSKYHQLIPQNSPRQGFKVDKINMNFKDAVKKHQKPYSLSGLSNKSVGGGVKAPLFLSGGGGGGSSMKKTTELGSKTLQFSKFKNQVHEEITEEPERSCNLDDFERLLEQTKLNLRNRKDKESLQVLEMTKLFQIHSNDQPYPLVSFFHHNESLRIPDSNLAFQKLMKHIEVLGLNQMQDIQPALSTVIGAKLRILNLSSNNICQTDFLGSFKSLEFLNLSNNRIKNFSMVGNCLKLREIYISYNRFTDLPNFFGLDDMVIISASFNLINNLENIANLTLNRKLNYLDLTGNPVTKKANYQNIMKTLLPQLKGIDVSMIEKFSEFQSFKEVCFASSNSQPHDETKKTSFRVSDLILQQKGSIPEKKSLQMVTSPVMSERSENFSPIQKKKKLKNNIPKLNIKSLQSFEFSTLKSSVSTNLGSTKPSLQFLGQSGCLKDLRLSTERSLDESPSRVRPAEQSSSKLLDIRFLSHREHGSIKFPVINSGAPTSPVVEFRKPVRVIHPNGEGLKLSISKPELKRRVILAKSPSALLGNEKENVPINTMNRVKYLDYLV